MMMMMMLVVIYGDNFYNNYGDCLNDDTGNISCNVCCFF
jgi:hypothetical protein